MASKSKAKDAEKSVPSLKDKGLQSFLVENIHRNQIKNAPYNPRTLSAEQKRKLKEGLRKHGLVSTLTWNKRTGNMVGGHQRMGQLDSLMGTEDYTFDIAVIDVDEVREKELNILLNNEEAQGSWDLSKLGDLLRTPDLDLAGAGFDSADIYKMFGGSLADTEDPLDELAAKVRQARESMNSVAREESGETEFYLVVVFRDGDQIGRFLKRVGLPDERYQSGEEVMRLCKAEDPK